MTEWPERADRSEPLGISAGKSPVCDLNRIAADTVTVINPAAMPSGTELFFGAPLDASHVRRNFRALCEKAGIEGIWTPRELRHTFVSERLRLPADAVPDRDRRVLPQASSGSCRNPQA